MKLEERTAAGCAHRKFRAGLTSTYTEATAGSAPPNPPPLPLPAGETCRTDEPRQTGEAAPPLRSPRYSCRAPPPRLRRPPLLAARGAAWPRRLRSFQPKAAAERLSPAQQLPPRRSTGAQTVLPAAARQPHLGQRREAPPDPGCPRPREGRRGARPTPSEHRRQCKLPPGGPGPGAPRTWRGDGGRPAASPRRHTATAPARSRLSRGESFLTSARAGEGDPACLPGSLPAGPGRRRCSRAPPASRRRPAGREGRGRRRRWHRRPTAAEGARPAALGRGCPRGHARGGGRPLGRLAAARAPAPGVSGGGRMGGRHRRRCGRRSREVTVWPSVTPSLAASVYTQQGLPRRGSRPQPPPEAVGAESGPGLRVAGGAGRTTWGLGCAAAPGPVQGSLALVQPHISWRMASKGVTGSMGAPRLQAHAGGLPFGESHLQAEGSRPFGAVL